MPGVFGNATHILDAIVRELAANYCEECLAKAFQQLDFSLLSSAALVAHEALHAKKMGVSATAAVGKEKDETKEISSGLG